MANNIDKEGSMNLPIDEEQLEAMRARMQAHMQELTGITDVSGIELVRMISMLSRMFESATCFETEEANLSGPRWGLLMHLLIAEKRGKLEGLTPTDLSRHQNVSKNTVSALLRGLEEQGLIQRTLDPSDHRIFRIQLTETGREMVKEVAPKAIAYTNRLASGMSTQERSQLHELLVKLYFSVLKQTLHAKTELDPQVLFHHSHTV